MRISGFNLSVGCIAWLLSCMAGCVNLNKSYPEKRSFVLDAGAEQREVNPEAPIVLKVGKLRVSPMFAGRAMVYRVGDLQYENDFYNEWFVAPSVLVTQQFQEWLAKSGRFRLVLTGTDHVEPTHRVEGTVTELYGDYRTAGSSRAVLAMDLHLVDNINDGTVVLRQTYRKEIPLVDRSPDGLAGGLSQAVRLVLVDFERDLAAIKVRSFPTSAQP